MSYEFGDIVLVPFPFTSQTTSKKRPAVIVSNARYNQSRPDVVVMAITSQIRSAALAGEAVVINWQAAGLLKPSVVKPVFATLEQTLVLRRLGSLGSDDLQTLGRAIAETLG